MKLAARKFAALLWIAAIILAIQIWYSFALTPTPINLPAGEFRLRVVVGDIAWTFFYSGGFFILGAIIWLLGDIRDRPELIVRDVLKRYVGEKGVRQLESGSRWPPMPSSTKRFVNFAVFEIKDDDPAEVNKNLTTLVPLITRNGGMVMGFPTVLLAVFENEPAVWFGELSSALRSPELQARDCTVRLNVWWETGVGRFGSTIIR